MKKIILFCSIALVSWTCSTEVDLLDDWKETTVVYGLLDQGQDTQYVRIQKAFLGPDNALSMAQQYDSINYINSLNVVLKEIDENGNIISTYSLSPVTFMDKDAGIFNSPMQVVYAMSTPAFSTTHSYRLFIDNSQTGNHCESATTLIRSFNITKPQGNVIEIRKITPATKVTVEWTPPGNSQLFQVGAIFHYKETDINGNTVLKATPTWTIETYESSSTTALSHEIKFDPDNFYRFLITCIAEDPNIVSRESDYIEFTVTAAGEELQTYMAVNSPSSSLVQERPFYTNIENGYGIFSSRFSKTKTNMTLANFTLDTLSQGHISCGLRFKDHNGTISAGCQ